MHGAFYLMMVTPVYIVFSFWATQEAIRNPTHHDIIELHSDYAVYAIPVVMGLSLIVCLLTKPNYDTLFTRLAAMGVLKGISQIITITPQPGGMEECIAVPIWRLKACADMMFSGHTCFIYLILYKFKYRWFLVFTMAFELVMADWHFMADCFIAVIVGYAIECKIRSYSYI